MLYNRNYHSIIEQLYFKNNLQEKKIKFVVTQAGGNWMKAVKEYKLPVIRLSTRDVTYNMISNTAVYYI